MERHDNDLESDSLGRREATQEEGKDDEDVMSNECASDGCDFHQPVSSCVDQQLDPIDKVRQNCWSSDDIGEQWGKCLMFCLPVLGTGTMSSKGRSSCRRSRYCYYRFWSF